MHCICITPLGMVLQYIHAASPNGLRVLLFFLSEVQRDERYHSSLQHLRIKSPQGLGLGFRGRNTTSRSEVDDPHSKLPLLAVHDSESGWREAILVPGTSRRTWNITLCLAAERFAVFLACWATPMSSCNATRSPPASRCDTKQAQWASARSPNRSAANCRGQPRVQWRNRSVCEDHTPAVQ